MTSDSSAHMKVAKVHEPKRNLSCSRCHKNFTAFEMAGFKRCPSCRTVNTKNWNRLMNVYEKAGVGQRIALTDEEKSKVWSAFSDECAFCGKVDPPDDPTQTVQAYKTVRLTRLIRPIQGGDDSLFNVIPCCLSCNQSRRNWGNWEDWFKGATENYTPYRFSRLIAWHNEQPMPKRPVYRAR